MGKRIVVDGDRAWLPVWSRNSRSKGTSSLLGFGMNATVRNAWLEAGTKSVMLELEGGPTVELVLKGSFWRKCAHFDHEAVRDWLISQGIAVPWPKGNPPRFEVHRVDGQRFRVLRSAS